MRTTHVTLFIALACGLTAHAYDKPGLTVELYEVAGAHPRVIREQLDRSGPLGADGIRHDGETRWLITWTYQASPDDGGCALGSFETNLAVTMTLPRWTKPEHAPRRLVDQWEGYSAALRLHEDGHHEIAVAAVEELERQATGLRSSEGCKSLGEELNRIADAVLAAYRKKEVEYDETTRHGATQGAVFPPSDRQR